MLKNPKKVLQAINNSVTVSLPLTSIDVEELVNEVTERLQLSNLKDVDVTSLEDGSLLIYNHEETKWKASRKLEKQFLDAGEY